MLYRVGHVTTTVLQKVKAKSMRGCGLDLNGSVHGPAAYSYEQIMNQQNLKGEEYPDHLSDYKLLKKILLHGIN
jgi:hypothetical protein